jgi:hypothetical protein
MAEDEHSESFGNGLRAYLGRRAVRAVAANEAQAAPPPDGPATDEPPRPLSAEDLAEQEQHLAERERQLREHIQAFEAHLATLARREADLREREAAAEAEQARISTERRNVREALREHAEGSLTRIFQVFDDALTADHPGGGADYGVRLAAVRALLAEAYAGDGDASATAAVVDELAEMRHRRTAT